MVSGQRTEADMAKKALTFLLLFLNFYIRRVAFITGNSDFSLLGNVNGFHVGQETFISSSLWQHRCRIQGFRNSRNGLLTLLLLMCGDIEKCPGPTRNIPELQRLLCQKGMKLLHQNVRGLFSNKIYISELFQSFDGIDVLTLSETHTEQDQNDLFEIPGYSFICRSRKSGKGGGVAAYIAEYIKWERRNDLESENIENIWIEIQPNYAKSILICIMYRPPDSSNHLNRNFNTELHEMLSSAAKEDKEMILLGDVNVNYLIPGDNKDFKTILNLHGLKQIITKPTRITEQTKTLIDIIATNCAEKVSDCEVIPASIGDHEMVGCVRKINSRKFAPKVINCRNYKNYDPETMKNELRKLDWSPVFSSMNVNIAWNIMSNYLVTVFNKHAPKIVKKIRGKPAPWLTEDIKTTMNKRDQLLRKYRKDGIVSDSVEYRKLRNEVNVKIRRAKAEYHKKHLEENTSNPSKFWRALKSIYPNKSIKRVEKTFQDIKSSDPQEISNGFAKFFRTSIHILKEKSIKLRDFVWRTPAVIQRKVGMDVNFKFETVNLREVEKLLKSTKRSKATGIDDLPPGMIKDSAPVIAGPLTHIINQSLSSGLFPNTWKEAKITPTHKSGSFSNFDNFRPISILPAISKIMEKIIHRQIMNYLNKNKLLTKFQFGFRPGMSTELAAALLTDNIRNHVDKGYLVGAVFLDLSKAFDVISHSKLLTKLPQYGITGKELNWFEDYLFNRKASVVYDNTLSEAFTINSGVPQGSILGPLLFVLFFNDITDVVKNSEIIKYADDTVIYVADKDIESINRKLTEDMNCMGDWLDENDLILNLKKGKTEALLFGTSQRIKRSEGSLNIGYKNTTVTVTNEYKYLGVLLDATLNLNSHFDKCFKKATSRLRLLRKLRFYLDVNASKAIYNTMILPTLTYCGILLLKLTRTQTSKLEDFHQRAKHTISKSTDERVEITAPYAANKRRACTLVAQTLNGEICEPFESYFTIQQHEKNTRNNCTNILIPSFKTEYARKGFQYMAAHTFNQLPIDIRKSVNLSSYNGLISNYFRCNAEI